MTVHSSHLNKICLYGFIIFLLIRFFPLFIGIISTNLLTELDIDRLGTYVMPMFH